MLLYHSAVSAALLSLSTTLLLGWPPAVSSHGYIKSPRSRNFVAHEDTVWWPVDASNPAPESDPQSANIGGVEARCGVIGGRNYDLPQNQVGGPMAPNPQACWRPGQVVDLEVELTAHHKGHMEFHACPIAPGEVPTQACFDAHPLVFVSGEGAPPDPNYPARAYLPPSNWDLKYKYRLPPDLEGDLVLLQWYYVTANSCSDVGYDQYDWPAGWNPNTAACPAGSKPPDGRGTPEQFWNCAEVRIASDCGGDGPPATTTEAPPTTTGTTATTTSTTEAPATTEGPTAATTSTTTQVAVTDPRNPNNTDCPAVTGACGPSTTCASIGLPGMCCSQWGYCGTTAGYCGGDCCQNGPCENGAGPAPTPPAGGPPAPPPPPAPTPPTTGFSYGADHGEDSRLIAYVGNWQACPTPEQVDAYSHIVVAFAVSYAYSPAQNVCDAQCNVASSVPVCGNQNRQDLVDGWRAAGKKVILSFGGAGMGGSWSGDTNNCWDYCFGKEETLSSSLVNIIDNQHFDGIDIDYEYCYDIAGKQSGRCPQRTAAYSDLKAQTFLDKITSKLRTKLDALQGSNGYNRGRYEVTHAPMDSDLTPSTSAYFRILHDRREDLDFLMPQFYNGVTRPGLDGVDGTGAGAMSAAVMFSSLANDLFDQEPHKVVFGFCISDCSGTGSNIASDAAVQVMSDLKVYNNDEFVCNGGAFFWVADHDSNGVWSNRVVQEVSLTAGCSAGGTPSPSVSPTDYSTYNPTGSSVPRGVTSSPTFDGESGVPSAAPSNFLRGAPSGVPSAAPSDSLPGVLSGVPSPSPSTSSSSPTKAPSIVPTRSPTTSPTNSLIKSPTNSPVKSPITQTGCIAVPQDQLPSGSWATTDKQCKLCESGTHPWWPCDTTLCDCSGSPAHPTHPTPPVKDPTPAPVNSPTAPNDDGGCSAVPQDQLPTGSWATTDEHCAICDDATIAWWPCNTNLCNCNSRSP